MQRTVEAVGNFLSTIDRLLCAVGESNRGLPLTRAAEKYRAQQTLQIFEHKKVCSNPQAHEPGPFVINLKNLFYNHLPFK